MPFFGFKIWMIRMKREIIFGGLSKIMVNIRLGIMFVFLFSIFYISTQIRGRYPK